MKKISVIIAASLFGILVMLSILTMTGVIGHHEIADAINNIGTGTNVTNNVQGVEEALQDIATVLGKIADGQEEMTSEVAKMTANLDMSDESFHKEVIALLEKNGFHCCCCKCSNNEVSGTQTPIVTSCSHENIKYLVGNGVHYKKCIDCEKILATINCKYNSNGYCYTCGGYRKPEETQTPETQAPETQAPACTHTSTKIVNNGNGTHSVVCNTCGKTISTVNCTLTNGTCTCGNTCNHNSTKVVSNGNSTHNVVCNTCGKTVSTVNCTLTNGTCTCGNTCNHSSTKAVNNGDGTHNVVCNTCGKTVSTVYCNYNNGSCACGKSCSHTTQLVPNSDNTHSIKCTKCNTVLSTVNCTFDVVYGKCTCGNTEGNIEYGHHIIYVGTDEEQVIKPNPGSTVIQPNDSDEEQVIKPNPGSTVIQPNGSNEEQVIKPNPSNNDDDYICTDPILPDGGEIIIKPNPGSGSNIIAPNPTN